MGVFQPSSLFSDGAVLCRGKEIRVFGAAELPVTAVLENSRGELLGRDTAESRDGRFLCVLPPQAAQTDCVLTLRCGGEIRECRNVAIGDVFLANGQSNMELELQNADEGPDCIRNHSNTLVRYYNVPKCPRVGPETEQANRDARWRTIAPGSGGDMSAVAYFFAMTIQRHTGVPVGIIDCYWGGTSISCWMREETLQGLAEGQRYLADYAEKTRGVTMAQYLEKEAAFQQAFDRWNQAVAALREKEPGIGWPDINLRLGPCPWNPPAGPGSPYRPFGLEGTMLERVVPCALTGVLFYQGEEDTARTERYEELLTAYIFQLRRQFMDSTLPFLNVQLPMWIDANARDSFTWPRLRLAQQQAASQVRHSGLAVLLDQGEYDNIHPTNKRVVGERLALEARRVIYGEGDAEQAPRAESKYSRDGALHVALTQNVRLRDGGDTLLEIAGEDGVFYPAETEFRARELVLSHAAVPRPVQARYAWTDYAIVRLFGENGLPLAPFWLK